MPYTDYIDSKFDENFANIPALKWLPWIGKHYTTNRTCPKLLIVGESHYAEGTKFETIEEVRNRHEADIYFTRRMLWEGLIDGAAEIRTFYNIPRLFFGDSAYNKLGFWQDVAFMNLVQRMMLYTKPPERPIMDRDYPIGWEVFYDVLNILRPDYCIFMGTEAHHRFWSSMIKKAARFSDVKQTEKIGKYWGYRADITIEDQLIPLAFVKHPGSYFSPIAWQAFIVKQFPSEISFLQKEYRQE